MYMNTLIGTVHVHVYRRYSTVLSDSNIEQRHENYGKIFLTFSTPNVATKRAGGVRTNVNKLHFWAAPAEYVTSVNRLQLRHVCCPQSRVIHYSLY